jgi:hypothetical protein
MLTKLVVILKRRLNPAVVALEVRIKVDNHSMGGMFDFHKLKSIWDL